MRILVTGANGFIGRHIIEEMESRGLDYIATDYHFDQCDSRHIECNLFDDSINYYTYFGCPDIVLHLAWREGFIHNSIRHMGDLSNHYLFLKNMIDAGVKHIAVMGSMHEVGFYEGKIDENTPCNPMSQYGVAKNALRQAMELMCDEKNVIFQWIRAFYIYSNDTTSSSIFSKILKAEKEGKQTFPFTTGKNKYDFITVEELSKQIVAVIMQDKVNGIINCCSGNPISLGEKIELFIKENNLRIRLNYGEFPDRKYDSSIIYGDTTKLERILEGK